MVANGQPWSEVQAFMHSQSYGNARQYVETFDWTEGKKKAQAEIDAWKAILRAEDARLQAAAYGEPVLLAQAMPQPNGPMTDVPANDPHFPKPRPQLRVVPPPEVPAAGRGLAALLAEGGAVVLFAVVLVLIPGNAFQKNTEDEDLRRMRAEYEKKRQLPIPLDQPQADATVDTTNNECKKQIEDNQKNGVVCENDGYVLMEAALKYKRLVNPPKGRGLDGLFEKLPALDQPNPMPQTVTQPRPGKLVFIPAGKRPPLPDYDYVANALKKPAAPTYPKFVVFEAKHISKPFAPTDTEGITKETKNRLGNTCDGLQMSEPWTEERIPRALGSKDSGLTKAQQNQKRVEISDARYARWLFACLPGPTATGQPSKLYVFIDVVAAKLDLESRAPKMRKSSPAGGNEL
ncbi:hypothetical protein [Ralstonia syzygii]